MVEGYQALRHEDVTHVTKRRFLPACTFATLNQIQAELGILNESQSQGFGITPLEHRAGGRPVGGRIEVDRVPAALFFDRGGPLGAVPPAVSADYTMQCVLHALCNAHHLRELNALVEIEKEDWARKMQRLLRRGCHLENLARERGVVLKPRPPQNRLSSRRPDHADSVESRSKIVIATWLPP
jgi:Transposase IS66 family